MGLRIVVVAVAGALALAAGVSEADARGLDWPRDPCALLSTAQVRALLGGVQPDPGQVIAPTKSNKDAQCSWSPRNSSASVVLFGNARADPHASALYECKHGVAVTGVGSYARYCPIPTTGPSFEVQRANVVLTIVVVPHGKPPTEAAFKTAAGAALKQL
jgi:hypothetical protein